jgi:RND superfamily putative drug exporter
VATGLVATGRIITSAASILVVVGLSFTTADVVIVKELGLGLAIAIGLDATLIRSLLVPATMRVLGDWNWWPSGRGARLARDRLGVDPARRLL